MKKKKILIIDDEKDFCFLMSCFFTPRNFDVLIALTLSDGMRILKEENPDVLLLDNNLPDGSGWAQTEYILATYPLMQLNLISALRAPKERVSTHRVLEKPLRWEELKEMF
jgi:two-component system OmpR family response regulator